MAKKSWNTAINMAPAVCLWQWRGWLCVSLWAGGKSTLWAERESCTSRCGWVWLSALVLCGVGVLCVPPGGSVHPSAAFCVNLVFLIEKKHKSKHKICVVLKWALSISVTLEQIYIFKTRRTDDTYLQTRSHMSPGWPWNSIIYENVIFQVQWIRPWNSAIGVGPEKYVMGKKILKALVRRAVTSSQSYSTLWLNYLWGYRQYLKLCCEV